MINFGDPRSLAIEAMNALRSLNFFRATLAKMTKLTGFCAVVFSNKLGGWRTPV